MIRLTDEEIFKACDEEYVGGADMDNACSVAQAQLKKVVEWGDEPCPHGKVIPALGNTPSATMRKKRCDKCWRTLKKEVE